MGTKPCLHKRLPTAAILFACFLYAVAPAEAGLTASTLTFTVANSMPSVKSVTCSRGGYLVWCNATVVDLNGHQDLFGCNGTLSSGNNLDTYFNNSCMLYGGSGNEGNCVCSFQLKDEEEGGWTASITAQDYETSGAGEGTISIIRPVKSDGQASNQETECHEASWLSCMLNLREIKRLSTLLGLDLA